MLPGSAATVIPAAEASRKLRRLIVSRSMKSLRNVDMVFLPFVGSPAFGGWFRR